MVLRRTMINGQEEKGTLVCNPARSLLLLGLAL